MNKGRKTIARDEKEKEFEKEESNYTIRNEQGEVSYC
jgi:hypothetical protein